VASLRKQALIAKHGRKAVLSATAQEQRSRVSGRNLSPSFQRRRMSREVGVAHFTKKHTPGRIREASAGHKGEPLVLIMLHRGIYLSRSPADGLLARMFA
jgi:hypothetical protein